MRFKIICSGGTFPHRDWFRSHGFYWDKYLRIWHKISESEPEYHSIKDYGRGKFSVKRETAIVKSYSHVKSSDYRPAQSEAKPKPKPVKKEPAWPAVSIFGFAVSAFLMQLTFGSTSPQMSTTQPWRRSAIRDRRAEFAKAP